MSAAPDEAAAAAGVGDAAEVDAFAARIFQQVLDGMEALAVYVGDRLGLYRVLASGDALSIDEFARRTGMHPRYAREWLEQQAVSGILTAQDDGDVVRFRLPGAHAEVLADERSLAYTSPAARCWWPRHPVFPSSWRRTAAGAASPGSSSGRMRAMRRAT